jgi:hypothetical protein
LEGVVDPIEQVSIDLIDALVRDFDSCFMWSQRAE